VLHNCNLHLRIFVSWAIVVPSREADFRSRHSSIFERQTWRQPSIGRPMITTAILQRDTSVLSDHPIEHKISRILFAILPWIAVLGSLLMLAVPAFLVPAEDATILHQYSDNWASTRQIAYYHGGPRVEGATDFLWMALLAGLRILHIPPFWATAVINLLSALAISYLILQLANRKPNFRSMLLLLGLVMLAPQLGAALAGFSVLPFAALLLTCVFFFCRERDVALASASLLLCLFRPDGVVFAVPLLALRLFSKQRGFRVVSASCSFSSSLRVCSISYCAGNTLANSFLFHS
jgi:hypothetical protein